MNIINKTNYKHKYSKYTVTLKILYYYKNNAYVGQKKRSENLHTLVPAISYIH